ncbi:MAG: DoxX family protein [Bacteroidetes bacterium 47-18]|nr:MAG: DoxX family protein [Bacteroidetes bacterium 47-18]
MKIVKTILFSLFGLLLLNSGLNKFLNYMPVPEGLPEALTKDNDAFAEISWLMPLVGFAEVLGGLLILVPRTRALGALVVFPVMAGVLLTHLTVAPGGLVMALILWSILLWIIIDNKQKYLPLINR